MPELLVKKEAIKLLQDMGDMDIRETLKFAPTYRTERYTYYSDIELKAYANGDDVNEGIGAKYYLLPVDVLKEQYRDNSAELLESILDAEVLVYHRTGKKFVRVRLAEIVSHVIQTS